jgi:maltose O-acetyltransferase
VPARPLLRLRTHGRVVAESGVRLGRGIVWDVAPGATVVLGHGCSIGARSRFHVAPGAVVVVGAGARLGPRCVVTAHERVDVGPQARLGAEVVLLDFDHDVADPEVPVRRQGLVTAPVRIGRGARIEDAAVVLRGVSVGPGARVGVRAVATADVPAGARVAGIPARPAGTPEPAVPAARRLARRG